MHSEETVSSTHLRASTLTFTLADKDFKVYCLGKNFCKCRKEFAMLRSILKEMLKKKNYFDVFKLSDYLLAPSFIPCLSPRICITGNCIYKASFQGEGLLETEG